MLERHQERPRGAAPACLMLERKACLMLERQHAWCWKGLYSRVSFSVRGVWVPSLGTASWTSKPWRCNHDKEFVRSGKATACQQPSPLFAQKKGLVPQTSPDPLTPLRKEPCKIKACYVPWPRGTCSEKVCLLRLPCDTSARDMLTHISFCCQDFWHRIRQEKAEE